jgi:hypothetical protein
MQPQTPPDRHWTPPSPAQAPHVAPPVPQSDAVVPDWHIVPSQQPPLHWPAPVHDVVHTLPLHAVPMGQSVMVLQPQWPATQAVPLPFPAQSTHGDAEPHAVIAVPGMHVPIVPPQQNPAPHAPPSQLAVHAPP